MYICMYTSKQYNDSHQEQSVSKLTNKTDKHKPQRSGVSVPTIFIKKPVCTECSDHSSEAKVAFI